MTRAEGAVSIIYIGQRPSIHGDVTDGGVRIGGVEG
jgi:hypothetical protein